LDRLVTILFHAVGEFLALCKCSEYELKVSLFQKYVVCLSSLGANSRWPEVIDLTTRDINKVAWISVCFAY
jgi:hypothetical protein